MRLFVPLLVLLWAGPAAAFDPIFSDPNSSTLPVTVTGDKLAGLTGAPLAQIRVFAATTGKPEIIPFQIDPRTDAKNDAKSYVFDGVPGPDKLSRFDELLFMLKDTGPRLVKDRWPAGAADAVELAVAHPDGRVGYAYAARFAQPPPLSAKSYMTYDPVKDTVSTPALTLRFRKDNPVVFDDIVYRDLHGRSDEPVADGMRIRVKARTMGTMVTLTRNEDDFQSRLVGYRTGPIRTLRFVEFAFSIGPLTLTTMMARFDMSCRTLDARVSFQLATAINAFLDDLSAQVTVDYVDLKGITFSTQAVPAGRVITGNSSPEGEYIPYGKEEWFTLSGRGLYQFNFLDFETGLNLENLAYFRDGPNPKPPERYSGQYPESGYAINRWKNVGTKPRSFRIVITNLEGVPSGGGSAMFRLYQSLPPVTAAKPEGPKVAIEGPAAEAERLRAQLASGGVEAAVRTKDSTAAEAKADVYILVGQPAVSRLRSSLYESRIPVLDWSPAGKIPDPGEARRGPRIVIGGMPDPAVLGRILAASKPGAPAVFLAGDFEAAWQKDLEKTLGGARLVKLPEDSLPSEAKDCVVLFAPDISEAAVKRIAADGAGRNLILFALSRPALDAGAVLGFTSSLEGGLQAVPAIVQAWLKGVPTAELKDNRELIVNRAVVKSQRTQIPAGILQLAKPVN